MKNLLDLLKVKSLVTLSLTFTFCGLLAFNIPVAPELKEILMLMYGFYFAKGTNKTE